MEGKWKEKLKKQKEEESGGTVKNSLNCKCGISLLVLKLARSALQVLGEVICALLRGLIK